MRIALLCPYSWTYPGGVTRHIEALAGELLSAGHDVKVLAPFDPDDAASRRLHRGGRPQPRQPPDYLVSLGRTIGLPANGAVSNLPVFPEAILVLRKELREGGYDVVHVHEPIVPLASWDALRGAERVPLVGTFHTYSSNVLSNGVARALGAGRRMNRLHVRIAVSEAAAWTGRRFFGGRYRVIPNGVHVPAIGAHVPAIGAHAAVLDGAHVPAPDGIDGAMIAAPTLERPQAAQRGSMPGGQSQPLHILFIGQAVERKGLPVLLKAFEALREHVPATTLTLVGAGQEQIAPLLLDGRGVIALGQVSEERKAAELAAADLLCAPSLGGESFGMVLTEAFAASTPVVASDITGYRDVLRAGVDGLLVPPGDPVALAEALRQIALQPQRRAEMARNAYERAQRFAWPQVAREVAAAYEEAIALAAPQRQVRSVGVRLALASADMLPPVRPQRLASLEPAPSASLPRRALGVALRAGAMLLGLAALALALIALQRIGVAKVIASLIASKPGLIAAGLAAMCASMVVRGLAWHAILRIAPTWRKARRSDALQGTFIGVLMSATLPVRLGETSRALVVARRIGRARETLPVVLSTMVAQTLINLLALAALGIGSLLSVDLLLGDGILLALALMPVALLLAALVARALLSSRLRDDPRRRRRQVAAALCIGRRRIEEGLSLLRRTPAAAVAALIQMSAWGLQLASCWLVMMALGLDGKVSFGAAAAVLFAVNATAFMPLTPANVGVFQLACVAVLTSAYHVSGPDALAYGIILQAIELATATVMGLPALMKEGLSWREVRLRTIHAVPVRLGPAQAGAQGPKAATDSW